jgi:hypothetical protein
LLRGEYLDVADMVALPTVDGYLFAVAKEREDGAAVAFAGDEAVEDASGFKDARHLVSGFSDVRDVLENVEEEDDVKAVVLVGEVEGIA